MSKSQRVRPLDLRALLRLTGELGERAREPLATRRDHALRGICTLLGARVGGYSLLAVGRSACHEIELRELVLVGFRPHEERALRNYLNQPDGLINNPVALHVRGRWTGENSRPFCLASREVLPAQLWYRAPYVQEVLRVCDVDPFLAAATRDPVTGHASYLTIRRAWRERPFSNRARQVFQLFFEAAGHRLADEETEGSSRNGRHAGTDPTNSEAGDDGSENGAQVANGRDPRRRISLRQQMVLERLLSGDSEKQVAARLGRSRHTVHRHVTALYRRFRVSSRAELMARFLAGEPALAPLIGDESTS